MSKQMSSGPWPAMKEGRKVWMYMEMEMTRVGKYSTPSSSPSLLRNEGEGTCTINGTGRFLRCGEERSERGALCLGGPGSLGTGGRASGDHTRWPRSGWVSAQAGWRGLPPREQVANRGQGPGEVDPPSEMVGVNQMTRGRLTQQKCEMGRRGPSGSLVRIGASLLGPTADGLLSGSWTACLTAGKIVPMRYSRSVRSWVFNVCMFGVLEEN